MQVPYGYLTCQTQRRLHCLKNMNSSFLDDLTTDFLQTKYCHMQKSQLHSMFVLLSFATFMGCTLETVSTTSSKKWVLWILNVKQRRHPFILLYNNEPFSPLYNTLYSRKPILIKAASKETEKAAKTSNCNVLNINTDSLPWFAYLSLSLSLSF